MKEQYNELFKEIHLSKTAKEKIREAEILMQTNND